MFLPVDRRAALRNSRPASAEPMTDIMADSDPNWENYPMISTRNGGDGVSQSDPSQAFQK